MTTQSVDFPCLYAKVGLGGSLSAAESLLHTARELIKAHRSQLAELFAPKWFNDWNLEKVFASELSLRESLFKIGDRPPWVHANFIRNRSLRFSRKIIEAVSEANGDVLLQKLKNISEAHVSVSAWTPDYVRDPFNTWFVRKLVINEIFPIGLVNSMIQLAGRTRLIALRMMIEQNDIPDQSVPDFLASVQNNLRNPFTGEPMRWSKEHRVIWFDQPEGTSTPIPHQVRLAGGHWLDK